MDLVQTGKFIAECRKAKNLTQQQLAESMFVTEKAVSKWECGRSFPDTSNLAKLSEVLGVSVNELLSGKKFESAEEGAMYADKNLLEATKHEATIDAIKLMLCIFATICAMLVIVNLIGTLVLTTDWSGMAFGIVEMSLFVVISVGYIVYYFIDQHKKRK